MPRIAACLLVVVSALVFRACASAPGVPSRDELHADALAFLREGVTTRREAILELGQPSASFEDQTILTWRLAAWTENGKVTVVFPETRHDAPIGDWRVACWSLVLVFDRDGRLADRSLVPVR